MSSTNPHLSEKAGNRPKIAPRDRILAAAKALFYAQGIRAVSVDAIAEAAETNKMTLYRHFASKEALVVEYLRELERESQAEWEAARRTFGADAEGQLRAFVDHLGEAMGDPDNRGCAFAHAVVELPEKDHPARAVIETHKIRQRENLALLCREARFAEPERLADEIFLLLEGARIDLQSVGAGGPGSRLIDTIRTLIKAHKRRD
jgi:AcrR family transcriptional regulator